MSAAYFVQAYKAKGTRLVGQCRKGGSWRSGSQREGVAVDGLRRRAIGEDRRHRPAGGGRAGASC